MTFLIGGANSATGYEIDNSARMTAASTGHMERTFDNAGNRKVFTWSGWVKRGVLGVERGIFGAALNSGQTNANCALYFYTDDTIRIWTNVGNQAIGTSAKYRDPAAWYHIVWTSEASNPYFKLYVNGSEVTYGTDNRSNYPGGSDTEMNQNNVVHYLGGWKNGSDQSMSGYLSEVHFLDGQTYGPSYFGETDDNGVWVPKKYTGGNYGDNGFYCEFKGTGTSANSSGIGADTSGNGNHWTPQNMTAEDVTTDTPSNNFATLNPLSDLNATLSEGNTQLVRNASSAVAAVATMAPANGKWYYEFQLSASNNAAAGVVDVDKWDSTTDVYDYDDSGAVAVLIESSDNFIVDYTEDTAGGTRLQNSVQLNTAKYGFAVDLDNQGFYASANGNWYTGSAFDDTDFSNATNLANDIPAGTSMAFFARGSIASASYANFGNPGGADSISSGNSDANGYGNFEYAVPSGYYALCTKNLAEYG